MSSNTSQAIARRVTPEVVQRYVEDVVKIARTPIRAVQELQAAYESIQGKCNLLTPLVHPDEILPLHRVSLSMAMIDTTVDSKGNGSNCYRGFFHKNNKLALNKVGLLKIMQAAALSIIGRPMKIDDRSDPHYSAYSVRVGGRDLRGIWREFEKEGICDFRKGSNMMGGWGAAQIESARAHIDSRAETKALEKAIKAYLAIPEEFSPEQGSLPWVIPVLVIDPDPSHPVDRAWLLNQGGQRTDRLYGALPAAGEAVETRELKAPPPVNSRGADDTPEDTRRTPTRETPDSSPAREDDEQLDLLDVSDDSNPLLCQCPCGDQSEVEEKLAADTKEKYGAIRCRHCVPAKSFDFGRHASLRGGLLGLPKYPKLTVEGLKGKLDEQAAAAGRK
jgi:hypothetical protein